MKNVMTRAWEIARAAAAKFGGKVREYIAAAMKQAWAEWKGTAYAERIIVIGNKDNGTYDVYGERNGKIFRSREGLNKDGYREAYGNLTKNFGIKAATFFAIENGVKKLLGTKVYA